ncbi:hypothetical GMC oxidoreductase [Postia placenta Mad-698-R]|nr:hypothetical GMC oxidoreductase [Postia placenta Mad-698-R]
MDKLAPLQEVSGKTFDFVIIGKYNPLTAGLVLANRLSENSSVTVAVLEAGKAHFEDPLVDKIDGWLQQMMKPDYDWEFFTVPQPHAHDKPARWSRLVQPRDVNNTIGTDGPISLAYAPTSTGAEASFQKAVEQLGVATVTNTAYEVGPQTNGAYKILSSIDPERGTRASSVTGYLLPAIHRPNLKVLTEAYVNEFVTRHEGDKLTATGVEFEHGGNVYQVHATKEVILSAGAIKSPNILELSGIGDRRVLEPLGIPVLKDIPGVGANVQEHYTLTGLVLGRFGGRSVDNRWADGTKEMRKASEAAPSLQTGASRVTAKSDEAAADENSANATVWTGITYLPLQLVSERASYIIERQTAKIQGEAATYPPGLKEQYDIQLDILRNSQIPDLEIMLLPVSFAAPFIGKPYISLPIVVSHPFARGTIHISSADPKATPLIDPRYFEEETERDILLEGFKFARKISNTSPLRISSSPKFFQDLRSQKTDRLLVYSAGSLSMMPQDKGGVVGPALRPRISLGKNTAFDSGPPKAIPVGSIKVALSNSQVAQRPNISTRYSTQPLLFIPVQVPTRYFRMLISKNLLQKWHVEVDEVKECKYWSGILQLVLLAEVFHSTSARHAIAVVDGLEGSRKWQKVWTRPDPSELRQQSPFAVAAPVAAPGAAIGRSFANNNNCTTSLHTLSTDVRPGSLFRPGPSNDTGGSHVGDLGSPPPGHYDCITLPIDTLAPLRASSPVYYSILLLPYPVDYSHDRGTATRHSWAGGARRVLAPERLLVASCNICLAEL